jgi:hypothetical protein
MAFETDSLGSHPVVEHPPAAEVCLEVELCLEPEVCLLWKGSAHQALVVQ